MVVVPLQVGDDFDGAALIDSGGATDILSVVDRLHDGDPFVAEDHGVMADIAERGRGTSSGDDAIYVPMQPALIEDHERAPF